MNPSIEADREERPGAAEQPNPAPASIDDETAREISENDDTPG